MSGVPVVDFSRVPGVLGGIVQERARDYAAADPGPGPERAPQRRCFQPVSCSALLVRDGATLGHVTWHADYLNPKDSAHPNQVDKSLQTTRRFEAKVSGVEPKAAPVGAALNEAANKVADEVAEWVG